MIKIRVLCVGKIKEIFFKEAIQEYIKRISAYAKIDIVEVEEERPMSKKEDSLFIKRKESLRILERIKEKEYVFLLDISGNYLSSEQFSEKIKVAIDEGNGELVFVIGGSHGVDENVKRRSDFMVSFSKLTFPHQMIRLFLVEQIYRSFKIINNESYHK